MKSLVIVHHPCAQDPRVVQVVRTLREGPVQVEFVGIGKLSAEADFSQISRASMLRSLFTGFVFARFFKSTISRAAFVAVYPWLVMALSILSLLTIIPFLFFKSVSKVFGFNFSFLMSVARNLAAPARFFYLFLSYFSTFYKHTKSRDPFEIVHCNDLETLLFGVYYKKNHNCYLIYDAHEFFPYQASWLKGLPRKMLEAYEKILIKNVDVNFMVSAPLARKMEAAYGLREKMLIVPNVFSKSLSLGPQSRSLEVPVKFHFIGGFLAERGIDVVIDLWKSVDAKKAVLHLRGPINEYYQHCVELAKRNGTWNKSVFFYPPVAEDEIVPVSGIYDVGVIPYLPLNINNQFCSPNKLSQYMLAGNAVLTNRLENVESVIQQYENGLVYNWLQPTSFLKAVNQLCDSEVLSKMKRNSINAAEGGFNWEAYSGNFTTAYQNLSRNS